MAQSFHALASAGFPGKSGAPLEELLGEHVKAGMVAMGRDPCPTSPSM